MPVDAVAAHLHDPGFGERRQRRQPGRQEGVLEDQQVGAGSVDDHIVDEFERDRAAQSQRERVGRALERATAARRTEDDAGYRRLAAPAPGPDRVRDDRVRERIRGRHRRRHDRDGDGQDERSHVFPSCEPGRVRWTRPGRFPARCSYLQVTVLCFLLNAQTGLGPEKFTCPHCPAGSSARVARSASAAGVIVNAPCLPTTLKVTSPGCLSVVLMDTLVMPSRPALLEYFQDVPDLFAFQPILVTGSTRPGGILTSATVELASTTT